MLRGTPGRRENSLDRRIREREIPIAEVEACQRQRNASVARIKFTFITQKARTTLAHARADTAKES